MRIKERSVKDGILGEKQRLKDASSIRPQLRSVVMLWWEKGAEKREKNDSMGIKAGLIRREFS